MGDNTSYNTIYCSISRARSGVIEMQKRYKKLDKMYNSLWKLVDRDNVDIYEFRNQVINKLNDVYMYDLREKGE